MSESQTLLLGFIAGVTILIGLPLGRMRAPRPGLRQFLNALAVGILLFLIWDVLVHAFEPIDAALGRLHDGSGGIGPVLGYAALFFLGLTVGLMSLVYYERWLARRRKPRNFGPGTMAPGELAAARPGIAGWSAARRMSLLIAVGIAGVRSGPVDHSEDRHHGHDGHAQAAQPDQAPDLLIRRPADLAHADPLASGLDLG